MKKLSIICMALVMAGAVYSQSNTVEIKTGTITEYVVYPEGLVIPLTVTFDSVSKNFVGITWKNSNDEGGRYVIQQSALDKATRAFWGPPQYHQEFILPEDQTLLLFSKANWKELQEKQRVLFDGNEYKVATSSKSNHFEIGGRKTDVIYLEGSQSPARIWLLNNADFPLILKMENNPAGLDLEIVSIKQ